MAVTLHSTVLCTVGSCEGTWITSMWVSTLTDCLDNPAHHPNTTRLYVISTCHLISSNAMSLPHIHIIANHSPPITRLWPNNEVSSTLQSLEGILFKRHYISTEFIYLAPGFVLWDLRASRCSRATIIKLNWSPRDFNFNDECGIWLNVGNPIFFRNGKVVLCRAYFCSFVNEIVYSL